MSGEEKKGVERFSISVEPELVREFEKLVERLDLSRSKAIQQAMRHFISEHCWSETKGECAGAVVVVYDHSVWMAEDELTDIQHGFRDVINSVLHVHIDEKNCLEIIAVKGSVDRVKKLTEAVERGKGVKGLRHTIVTVESPRKDVKTPEC